MRISLVLDTSILLETSAWSVGRVTKPGTPPETTASAFMMRQYREGGQATYLPSSSGLSLLSCRQSQHVPGSSVLPSFSSLPQTLSQPHTFRCLESLPHTPCQPLSLISTPIHAPQTNTTVTFQANLPQQSSSANQVIWGPVAHFVPTSEIKPPCLHGCSIGLWSPQL